MLSPRVLCVDDQPQILTGLERTLFEHFDVTTAGSGSEALEVLAHEEPFAVIVSDMRMPEMNGVEFLAQAKHRAPSSIRLLLTGHAEVEAAIDAINRGSIYRYLCKPCPSDELVAALNDAVEQHRLLVLERDMLPQTVMGAVRAMVHMLDLLSPTMGRRAEVLASYTRHACTTLELEAPWLFETAALLSQVGRATLPGPLLDRLCAAQPLSDEEATMVQRTYRVAAEMVADIPRLGPVASILRGLDGSAVDTDDARVPLGVRLLQSVERYEDQLQAGVPQPKAAARLARTAPELAAAISSHAPERAVTACKRSLFVDELRTGMVLDQDAQAKGGAIVARERQRLTLAMIERLRNFDRSVGLEQPFHVAV